MAVTLRGTIKTLKRDKGYMFILAEDGQEYFAHSNMCADAPFSTLSEGDPVRFVPGQGEKGPRALSVSVI